MERPPPLRVVSPPESRETLSNLGGRGAGTRRRIHPLLAPGVRELRARRPVARDGGELHRSLDVGTRRPRDGTRLRAVSLHRLRSHRRRPPRRSRASLGRRRRGGLNMNSGRPSDGRHADAREYVVSKRVDRQYAVSDHCIDRSSGTPSSRSRALGPCGADARSGPGLASGERRRLVPAEPGLWPVRSWGLYPHIQGAGAASLPESPCEGRAFGPPEQGLPRATIVKEFCCH